MPLSKGQLILPCEMSALTLRSPFFITKASIPVTWRVSGSNIFIFSLHPLCVPSYGLKVDIWAAGVITYILLCGFPPFRRSVAL